MDFTWAIKYATEFLATALLIILGMVQLPTLNLRYERSPKWLARYRCWLRYGGYDPSLDVW